MQKRNKQSEEMKEYMAEGLLLLMQKKPFKKITIQEITDRAGVNRSTYYRNFFSKEAIIGFYLEGLIDGYLGEYGDREGESLQEYLHILFNHFYSHQKQLMCIYNNGLSYLLLEAMNSRFTEYYHLKTADAVTRYGVGYHLGGIYNHFLIWFSGGMAESPKEMTRIALAILPEGTTPFLRRK